MNNLRLKNLHSPEIAPIKYLIEKEISTSLIFSIIFNFAFKNRLDNVLDELIHKTDSLDYIVDFSRQRTALAMTASEMNYHHWFKKLLDAGANPHTKSNKGEIEFLSNVLHLSIYYNEFENIEYLYEKKICSLDEILLACFNMKNFILFQHFLNLATKQQISYFIAKSKLLPKKVINKKYTDSQYNKIIDTLFKEHEN